MGTAGPLALARDKLIDAQRSPFFVLNADGDDPPSCPCRVPPGRRRPGPTKLTSPPDSLFPLTQSPARTRSRSSWLSTSSTRRRPPFS